MERLNPTIHMRDTAPDVCPHSRRSGMAGKEMGQVIVWEDKTRRK
jgi:hypothetical protein